MYQSAFSATGAGAAGGGAATTSAFDADVKLAVDTFGTRPESKSRILDLAARFRGEIGEHGIRSMAPGSFFEVCEGNLALNPDGGSVDYWRRKARLKAQAAANGKGN